MLYKYFVNRYFLEEMKSHFKNKTHSLKDLNSINLKLSFIN